MCDWAKFIDDKGNCVSRFAEHCNSKKCRSSPNYDEKRYGAVLGPKVPIEINETIIRPPGSESAKRLAYGRSLLEKRNQLLSELNFDNSGATGPAKLDVVHSFGYNWGDPREIVLGPSKKDKNGKKVREKSPPPYEGPRRDAGASSSSASGKKESDSERNPKRRR